MTRTAIAIFLFAIILVLGCAKDIIVPPITTLAGVYHGEYKVIRNYGGNDQTHDEEWIEWHFTDQTFSMTAERLTERPKVFCDWFGFFELKSNIIFSKAYGGADQCDPNDRPDTTFTFRRISTEGRDSIYMFRIYGTPAKKVEIRIGKASATQ